MNYYDRRELERIRQSGRRHAEQDHRAGIMPSRDYRDKAETWRAAYEERAKELKPGWKWPGPRKPLRVYCCARTPEDCVYPECWC